MTQVSIQKTELEASALRRAMGRFATGITIITAQQAGEIEAMTANAVCTISFEPMIVMVCVNKKARMNSFIQEAGHFGINILTQEQEIISRYFAEPGKNKAPDGLKFENLEGIPLLDGTLASVACKVDQVLDAGDHSMILGRVEALRYSEDGEEPLLYFRGRYRRLEQDTDKPNLPEFWLDGDMRIYYEEW
jgi:flavin reductase (DIM6/NTAB) family NADH-FMN oxidoreductase RutF